MVISLFHQSRRSVIFPTAAASSAYHVCLQCPSSSLISGIVARAYMGMASGSPCVVPSCDRMVSPPTKRSVGALYVFTRMVDRGGQILLMLWSAACLLRVLKALLASTSSTASFSSKVKADLTACTAASIPEICPPHNWMQPVAAWTSGRMVCRTALAMMRLAVSPMPIGRTPGCLSRAINRQARNDDTDLGST